MRIVHLSLVSSLVAALGCSGGVTGGDPPHDGAAGQDGGGGQGGSAGGGGSDAGGGAGGGGAGGGGGSGGASGCKADDPPSPVDAPPTPSAKLGSASLIPKGGRACGPFKKTWSSPITMNFG